MPSLHSKTILVTGGNGFLGSYVIQELRRRGVENSRILAPSSKEYDLREKEACEELAQKSDVIIHLAGVVGGIGFNQKYPGTLFYDNAIMGIQLMEAARKAGAEKFVTVGTVCSYPKFTPMPFQEENLWDGYPEETNAPYGLAKKMMLVQSQAYHEQYGLNAIHLLQINLYGPGDHFAEEKSHVIPALIKKVDIAKTEGKSFVEAWGTGSATREFLYAEDAACGIVLATEHYDKPEPINLGSGMEISIKDLLETICELMGFKGEIRWDTTKPDGQLRRMLDTSKARDEFGFEASVDFREGLRRTIDWYYANKENL